MTCDGFASLINLGTLITGGLLHEYFKCDVLKSISEELAQGIVHMDAVTQIGEKDIIEDAQVEKRCYQTKKVIREGDASQNAGITGQGENETIKPFENGTESHREDVKSVEYVKTKI